MLAAAVSCSVPGTQLRLQSMEVLWLSKGNLNSLEAKGAHGDEQQERLAQKGDGEAGEGQELLGKSQRGLGWIIQEQSAPDQGLGGPGAAFSPQEGCAAQGSAPERRGSPSLGSVRLGWAGPRLALSRAGDSPAPKGGWIGAPSPSSAAGMILEDLS